MYVRYHAKRASLVAMVVACMLGFSRAASAQPIPGYPDSIHAFDPREIALLPRFCSSTQHFREHVPGGNDPALIRQWGALLGPTFVHLHHYCYGLMKMNRGTLLARDPRSRQAYLSDAVGEMDYVIERSPSDFVLLPEVLTKKGEILVRLGKAAVAVVAFERAIEVKPDYWPPYAQLSDYYRNSGDIRRARETLEVGLGRTREATALARRLRELDGKR